jgi:uncharacterized protein YuzE
MYETSYKAGSDIAYIRFTSQEVTGPVESFSSDLPEGTGGAIILDFSADGRLVGMEVLEASRLLSADYIARLQSDSFADGKELS